MKLRSPPYKLVLADGKAYCDSLTDWIHCVLSRSDKTQRVFRETGHNLLPHWRIVDVLSTRRESFTPEEIKELEFLINQKLTLEDQDDRRVVLSTYEPSTFAASTFKYIDIKRLGGRVGLLNI